MEVTHTAARIEVVKGVKLQRCHTCGEVLYCEDGSYGPERNGRPWTVGHLVEVDTDDNFFGTTMRQLSSLANQDINRNFCQSQLDRDNDSLSRETDTPTQQVQEGAWGTDE